MSNNRRITLWLCFYTLGKYWTDSKNSDRDGWDKYRSVG